MLENYCAFSKNHKCIKYDEYVFIRDELSEADECCHGNWIEIQKLYDYIDELKKLLDENNISYPFLY